MNDEQRQIDEIKAILTNTSELAVLTGKAVEDLIYELTQDQVTDPFSMWSIVGKLQESQSQLMAINHRQARHIDYLTKRCNKHEIAITELEVKLAVLTDEVIALRNLPVHNGYIAP